MDTKTPTTSQHQRAPRTPESYFNVPESIALLNIVKSERIQSAFQSNRKNHASVWEMVAEILNRFSARKRSAKQCCNRYENLKKIYTQLKKNPEKHVRRNWPYMYLFKEIEDQRGETWGANGKRLQMGAKDELSYYHRRRAAALNLLMNKDAAQQQQNGGEDHSNGKVERYMANSFVEAQLNDYEDGDREDSFRGEYMRNNHMDDKKGSPAESTAVKHEPISDSDFNPDDITLVQCDYNGSHNFYPHNIDPNLLHPDVIVDTDNISESSSRSAKSKRKTSTSTDGDSTNYELIEYLKRRERRDEEMFKRMEEREKRLLNLLERTDTKTPTTSQHQRAPRTPESYFNVPESIALLNIVKSERIQSAFQSNRKNHASVWEMVAEILNRFSARKRSAKQCCNRYENLKKIYTQLKKNPEKHVRRNWPYMYLFKEIEDQRGETWGANGKRLQMGAKDELSYYHRRRAAALNLLMNKDAAQQQQNGGEDHSNGKVERYMANSFVEAQLNDYEDGDREDSFRGEYMRNNHMDDKKGSPAESTAVKHEPISDSDFNPDDITLVQCDYNGSHNFYPHNIDPNLLHPDVIVDTDNISESSSRSAKSKRKTSTSTDGDSTNYELIEYLKRRERRDEEMFKRMEEREKRLLNLLERTVIAIECLAGTRTRFE